MTVFQSCLAAIGPYADPASIAGCDQAQATLEAARIGADATSNAAARAVFVGVITLAAGLSVLAQPWMAARFSRADGMKAALRVRSQTAKVYLAEIESLNDYLRENGVIENLRANANLGTRMYFDPGSHWLQTFSSNSLSVGVFDAAMATDLTAYCAQMMNELGRLFVDASVNL